MIRLIEDLNGLVSTAKDDVVSSIADTYQLTIKSLKLLLRAAI
jgi:hypothetical protein